MRLSLVKETYSKPYTGPRLSGKARRLVAEKSRFEDTNLTIPRLELAPGHKAMNLAVNARNASEEFKTAENIHCWSDSSVALHWLNNDRQYRHFVANRVNKIRSHPNVLWRYVSTAENPTYLRSREGGEASVTNLDSCGTRVQIGYQMKAGPLLCS